MFLPALLLVEKNFGCVVPRIKLTYGRTAFALTLSELYRSCCYPHDWLQDSFKRAFMPAPPYRSSGISALIPLVKY
jgi:hypothetical protein